MTLILNGTDGISDVDGSAATPAVRGTDTNTGLFFPAADTIAFAEGGAEVARITNTGAWSFGASGTATGTSGQVLTSQGSGAAPTWSTVSAAFTQQVYSGLPTGTWSRAASRNGTYSQTTTVVTVTVTAHGLATGDYVFLDFTSGTAIDAWFVVTVTGPNTFTVTRGTATTSGNVTLHMPVVVTITSQSSHGLSAGNRAVLRFNATLSTASYVVRQVTANSFQLDGGQPIQQYNNVTTTLTTAGGGLNGTVEFFSINRTATWTKPAGLSYARITVTGGGGQAMSSATGGAGGTSIKIIAAASLGATEAITVGKGGAEQMGNTSSEIGTPGATSSFGAHCSATGGGGGDGSIATQGAGGNGAGGDINVAGGNGGTGTFSAASYFGSAPAIGAGGTTTVVPFAQGAFGVVIVEEFY